MREIKKHWRGNQVMRGLFNLRLSLCGLIAPRFASKKQAVTCKTCTRILAGYQTKEK